jgi:DNA-directed RNA polymerase subunit M/transcription elongation factor TFIIS
MEQTQTLIQLTQEFRTNIKNKINNIIKDDKMVNLIEESIYEFSYNYAFVNDVLNNLEGIYETKMEDIYRLLTSNETTLFFTNLKNGKIDPTKIGLMRPDELNPDNYDKIKKKKQLEEYNQQNQATSNMYTCKKCKNKKCQVTQRQTRSADESATSFIKCMECDFEWSKN